MNTNEPTTGEIVRALRSVVDVENCNDGVCFSNLKYLRTVIYNAADRLESQERSIEEAAKLNEKQANAIAELHEQIAEKNDEIQMACDGAEDTIKTLTARAESAERERDAFIDKIRGRCAECKHEHLYSYVEPCESCHNANGHPNWEWRGLPQEGEGK